MNKLQRLVRRMRGRGATEVEVKEARVKAKSTAKVGKKPIKKGKK